MQSSKRRSRISTSCDAIARTLEFGEDIVGDIVGDSIKVTSIAEGEEKTTINSIRHRSIVRHFSQISLGGCLHF